MRLSPGYLMILLTYGCQFSLVFQSWLHTILGKCGPAKTVGGTERLLDSGDLGERSGRSSSGALN